MRFVTVIFLLIGFATGNADIRGDRESGDGVVLVRTKDGEAFEGRRVRATRSRITYETALGRRVIATESFESESSGAEERGLFEERRQAAKRRDRNLRVEHLGLAHGLGLTSIAAGIVKLLLLEDGSDPEAWKYLAEAATRYDVAEANPEEERGSDRWNRKEVDRLFRALDGDDYVRAGVIACRLEGVPAELLETSAIRSAERGSRAARFAGVRILALCPTPRRVPTLYRAALADPESTVRNVAVDSLSRRDDGTTWRPFAKALLKSRESIVRANAAEALAALGDARAVAPLVRAMKATSDAARARSNIQSLTQTAYVKDYDVEVAQTAFIADPLVDVVLDGLVLDVAVLSIAEERRVIGRALGRLTGRTLDPEPAAWSRWWDSEGRNAAASKAR